MRARGGGAWITAEAIRRLYKRGASSLHRDVVDRLKRIANLRSAVCGGPSARCDFTILASQPWGTIEITSAPQEDSLG